MPSLTRMLVMLLVAVGAVIGLTVLGTSLIDALHQNQRKATDVIVSQQNSFVQSCSGVDTSNVSYAFCLGFIRGIVDQHNLVVSANGEYGERELRLWCVPQGTTTQQLFSAIEQWYNNNQDTVDLFRDPSRNDVALATVIAGLHNAYPCRK